MDLSSCNWKPFLPLLLVTFLFFYEEWVSIPTCDIVPKISQNNDAVGAKFPEGDLKVMMVANLLLLGSKASFFDHYFRDYYMSKFFRKSFYTLKPDMLLVLGDVSAKGFELTRTKWVSVLHQFHGILGPFLELPFHVVLGDRDVGECNKLDLRAVDWISRTFPGLDSSGCGGFEIGNVSFISLNSVALLCGNNKLRFNVESAIESESLNLRAETRRESKEVYDYGKFRKLPESFMWRENAMSSGSGPILLLHFPLHLAENDSCKKGNSFKKATSSSQHGSVGPEGRRSTGTGPYDLLHTIPPNATEYIFQALKPRIIFSAHSHEFCDCIHSDGTREVTVPAVTWKAKDDPGFVFVTFHGNKGAVSVSYCSLVRESHVLMVYTCALILLIVMWFRANTSQLQCLK